ncbi:MAG: GNAT family N-acetyltransferase [Planctomycetaceae bacterium]|nr:GNAT family N-acetyltransferase [Planctomycetaceae bacterium]
MTLSFQDLTDQPQDLALLARFYADVYIPGFPDANERESLENMQAYLALKRAGWYQSNNYHILLAVEDGAPIACSISDYLAEPNAGVLEFLLVDPQQRGRGLGQELHAATETLLQTDARRAGHAGVSCIAIEMNDPYRVNPADDNMDPFARARLWGRWGYGALGFPYVQPALSTDQGAVDYLILGAKPLDDPLRGGFPPQLVRQIVYGYLRWAMRIENPEANPQFQGMSADLSRRRAVSWTPFAAYLGTDLRCPFLVQEVRAEDDEFAAAMRVFQRSFPPGPTTIGPQAFQAELSTMSASPPPAYRYHLWTVRQTPESDVAGMLSFFSFPGCGFVGYVAVEPPLRGPRIVQLLLARMEEQLIRDFGDIRGWFMETSLHHSNPRALARLGFHRLVERFTPPSHANLGAADVLPPTRTPLGLFYKACGNDYGVLRTTRAELLEGVAQWVAGVYKVLTPESILAIQEQLHPPVD